MEKQNLFIMLTPTILDDRAPFTGLEGMAMQVAEELEKVPQTARKAAPTNDTIRAIAAPGEANKKSSDEPMPVIETSEQPAEAADAVPGNGQGQGVAPSAPVSVAAPAAAPEAPSAAPVAPTSTPAPAPVP